MHVTGFGAPLYFAASDVPGRQASPPDPAQDGGSARAREGLDDAPHPGFPGRVRATGRATSSATSSSAKTDDRKPSELGPQDQRPARGRLRPAEAPPVDDPRHHALLHLLGLRDPRSRRSSRRSARSTRRASTSRSSDSGGRSARCRTSSSWRCWSAIATAFAIRKLQRPGRFRGSHLKEADYILFAIAGIMVTILLDARRRDRARTLPLRHGLDPGLERGRRNSSTISPWTPARRWTRSSCGGTR